MAPYPQDETIGCYPAPPIEIMNPPNFQQNISQSKRQLGHQQDWRNLMPTMIRPYLPDDFTKIVWKNVMIFVYLHIAGLSGLYMLITEVKILSTLWISALVVGSGIGVTCGAHRLWAHKTYKAKLLFRLFLAFWQTVALENSIYEWARDHRVHHKFTDTDADPHNVNRGFFFSHIGWLMTKKHKDVIFKGKTVDLSDLEEDIVVRLQKKYYLFLVPVLAFGFPMAVPWLLWNESWFVCWNACAIFRLLIVHHGTWCINSVTHFFGTKPFDRNVSAVENLTMGFFAFGEGWHNYHHVFPWDYKAAEFRSYYFNVSAVIIEYVAKMGLAYDLKTVSVETIAKRATRTGDGSRKYDHILDKLYEDHRFRTSDNNIWGWDDKDMTQDEKEITKISHAEGCQ